MPICMFEQSVSLFVIRKGLSDVCVNVFKSCFHMESRALVIQSQIDGSTFQFLELLKFTSHLLFLLSVNQIA